MQRQISWEKGEAEGRRKALIQEGLIKDGVQGKVPGTPVHGSKSIRGCLVKIIMQIKVFLKICFLKFRLLKQVFTFYCSFKISINQTERRLMIPLGFSCAIWRAKTGAEDKVPPQIVSLGGWKKLTGTAWQISFFNAQTPQNFQWIQFSRIFYIHYSV